MELIVGATGMLGGEIAAQLRARKRSVRALVRTTSRAERVAQLQAAGAELAIGDLKSPESLARACSGVQTVISTATCTNSRSDGDGIDTVDGAGQLALIDAARAAGVRRFVFVSFPRSKREYPLQTAKRAAEARLVESGLAYTILQPPHFFETWFSEASGFDWKRRTARIFGRGAGKLRFVSCRDVARVAADALDNESALNRTFAFGGPEARTQRDIIRIFEERCGSPFTRQVVSAEELEAQCARRDDALAWSFAALMLLCDAGDEFDVPAGPPRGFPQVPFRDARAFAETFQL